MDSAFTGHKTKNKQHFCEFLECEGSIEAGNNENLMSSEKKRKGCVTMLTVVAVVEYNSNRQDVLYAPDIAYDLVSVSKIRNKNYRVAVNCDEQNMRRGIMKVVGKSSGTLKFTGIEIFGGLYIAVL